MSASVFFPLQGLTFKLEQDANGRRVIDQNGVVWSTSDLVELGGEVEATTVLAYALRDLEREEDRVSADVR